MTEHQYETITKQYITNASLNNDCSLEWNNDNHGWHSQTVTDSVVAANYGWPSAKITTCTYWPNNVDHWYSVDFYKSRFGEHDPGQYLVNHGFCKKNSWHEQCTNDLQQLCDHYPDHPDCGASRSVSSGSTRSDCNVWPWFLGAIVLGGFLIIGYSMGQMSGVKTVNVMK
jgi:hypothetical protein